MPNLIDYLEQVKEHTFDKEPLNILDKVVSMKLVTWPMKNGSQQVIYRIPSIYMIMRGERPESRLQLHGD